MIIGFGSDIIDIRRIEKTLASQGERFEKKLFTPGERKTARGRGKSGAKIVAATYAKRFAAKEAFLKALGTGFRGISWQEMEVVLDTNGAPSLTLSGKAAAKLKALTPKGKTAKIWLTLADDYPCALAQVIIEVV